MGSSGPPDVGSYGGCYGVRYPAATASPDGPIDIKPRLGRLPGSWGPWSKGPLYRVLRGLLNGLTLSIPLGSTSTSQHACIESACRESVRTVCGCYPIGLGVCREAASIPCSSSRYRVKRVLGSLHPMAVAAYPPYCLYSPSWCASTLCAAAHALVDLSMRSRAGTLYIHPLRDACTACVAAFSSTSYGYTTGTLLRPQPRREGVVYLYAYPRWYAERPQVPYSMAARTTPQERVLHHPYAMWPCWLTRLWGLQRVDR